MGLFGLFGKKKKEETKAEQSLPAEVPSLEESYAIEVSVQELSGEVVDPSYELSKVEDPATLNRLLEVFPNVASAVKKSVSSNGKTLYECTIPLSELKDAGNGTVRAFAVDKSGIKKHAYLTPLANKAKLAAAGATAFQVAAIIVGQHYMAEISRSMAKITDGIADVIEFQTLEYQSKVKTLLHDVIAIANNQDEILSSEELRTQELRNIGSYEHECEQLLIQANDMIDAASAKQIKDYKGYEKKTLEAKRWLSMQEGLCRVLDKMTDLKHALNLGNASLEYCKGKFNDLLELANHSREKLSSWHAEEIKVLGIDLEEGLYRKDGIFNKVVSKVTTAVKVSDKAINCGKIAATTIEAIQDQASAHSLNEESTVDAFKENLRLFVKDGAVYLCKKTLKAKGEAV